MSDPGQLGERFSIGSLANAAVWGDCTNREVTVTDGFAGCSAAGFELRERTEHLAGSSFVISPKKSTESSESACFNHHDRS